MGTAISPNDVKLMDDGSYLVKSQSSINKYEVQNVGGAWTCTCPHHQFRGAECKHIIACQAP